MLGLRIALLVIILTSALNTGSVSRPPVAISTSSSSRSHFLSPSVSLSNDQWLELGPKPIGIWPNCCTDGQPHFDWGDPPFSGRVTAITINASDTSNIYVGASSGGVWKTTDGGFTWTPITDDQTSLATGSITISSDMRTLYVGTGDPNHSADSYAGAGILRSLDGGITWTILGANMFKDAAISNVLTFAGEPNRLLVSTTWAMCCRGILITNPSSVGVFLSTNGGISWQRTLGPVNATENLVSSWDGFSSLIAHPTNSSIAYAGDFAGNAWETKDKGANWVKILVPTSLTCTATTISTTKGDIRGSGCRVALAVTPRLPNVLFGAWSNSTSDFSGSVTF